MIFIWAQETIAGSSHWRFRGNIRVGCQETQHERLQITRSAHRPITCHSSGHLIASPIFRDGPITAEPPEALWDLRDTDIALMSVRGGDGGGWRERGEVCRDKM
ncbi:hypothetical protein J6590_005336 [Homalodisca vitripennis]|nr:hypothetical protein J6590_005336 [Homalodisca vitripennis]